jgi:hypothetical protein
MRLMSRALLLMLVLLLALPTLAQDDLSNVVEVSDGYSIAVPDDWTVEEDTKLGGFVLSNDDISIWVLGPQDVAELGDVAGTSHPANILPTLYAALYEPLSKDVVIDRFTVGERDAATFPWRDAARDGEFIVLEMSDGEFGIFESSTEIDQYDDAQDMIDSVLATFDVSEEGQTDSGGAAVTGGGGEPCIISASEASTVQMRVGPGTNRSSIAFLPANQQFEATGRFTTDDGGVWFQLDKNEAAPNTAAAEIWVAETQVETSGDCDSVADASAPPIVPIRNNPPPVPTAVPGSPDQPPPEQPPANNNPPPQGAVIPQSGRWSINLDSTLLASCAGTDTVRIPAVEVFEDMSYFVQFTVSRDGSSMTDGFDTYVLQSDGQYFGTFDFGGGLNAQLRMRPSSPTFMTGTGVINFNVDALACSGTIPFTVTRG